LEKLEQEREKLKNPNGNRPAKVTAAN